MTKEDNSSISYHFSNITDQRRENRRHKLVDIIAISICAVICNADGFTHIAEFGRAKHEWFKEFLELPHGIPSVDTFERVFARIDPEEFKCCFVEWVKNISQLTKGEIVSLDGKMLRRSYDKGNGKSAIHMVRAWASENGIVLGQIKTNQKSNEITAIPKLLKTLEIEGCIVTIDAMGCQTNIANIIVDKKADYVLSLKGNQGNLHKNIELFFQDHKENNFEDIPIDYYEIIDAEHGKIEIRKYWTTSELDWLQGKGHWAHTILLYQIECL